MIQSLFDQPKSRLWILGSAALISPVLSLGSLLGLDLGLEPGDDDARIEILIHTLLEWTAAGLALGIAALAASSDRQAPARETLVLAVCFPVVAAFDALHALNGWLFAVGDPAALDDSLAWIASRSWTALALALALIGRGWRPVMPRRRTARWVGLGAGLVFFVTVLGLTVSPSAPGALPALPWDLLPLLLIGLAAAFSLTSLLSSASPLLASPPSPLLLALLICTLPQALCQVEALLGQPFDGHFMLSHGHKLIAYALLAAGLYFDLDRHRSQNARVEEDFQLAQQRLASTTEELQRVDRELVQQELQRRLAESSLRMLEKAVETMSLGVTITDPEGRILYVNPADARMHGFEVEELLGKHARLFAAPGPTASEPVGVSGPWSRERLDVTRLGEAFPVHLVSDQVRDPDDTLVATVTTCEDISERKRISEALTRRDRILEAVGLATERLLSPASWGRSFGDVLERLGQATGVDRVYMNLELESLSSEGVTHSWAPPDSDLDETSGIFDLPPRAGLFLRWRQRLQHGQALQGPVKDLPPDEREILEARSVRSFAAVPIFVESQWHGYLSLEDSEEHREWSAAELEALKIAATALGAAIQRREADEALAASEAQFRDLLENANDLIQSVSHDGKFLFVNRAWKRTLGYDHEEIEGLNIRDILHAEHHQPYQQMLKRILENGGGGRLEAVFVAKGGREISVEGSLSSRYHQGKVIASRGIFRDITDRKMVDRMKQELISMVSHELRTPLTSILAALGLLRSGKLDAKPERAQELLAVAHRNSNRLLQLINDLLDVQKLAANRMSFAIEIVALQGVLEEVMQGITSFADSHRITLELQGSTPELSVRTDRNRLLQVLNHLLTNAIKFSPAGETVTLAVEPRGSEIRLAITDRGEGIPEAFKSRLFDQFTQADSSHTRTHGGSGLGLNIVKGLVEGMKGRVSVDSEVGRGTTFYVDLPASAPVVAAEPSSRP